MANTLRRRIDRREDMMKRRVALFVPMILMLIGAYVAFEGWRYGLGTAARLGAGSFPLILGLLLVGASVVLLTEVWGEPPAAEAGLAWRPLLAVVGSLVVFAATVERFGLVPATVALVVVAASAAAARVRTTIGLAIVVAALAVALFLYGLNLPLRIVRF